MRTRLPLLVIVCVAGILVGGLILIRPAKFSKFEGNAPVLTLAFQYPEGWRLEQEEGTIDPYRKVRLLGPRNREDTYTCYISVTGFPKKELGGKFETLDEFARHYKQHLLANARIEAEGASLIAGQNGIDLTTSSTIPPLYKHGLKAIEIPVKTRTVFIQNGSYLYQIIYGADVRDYGLHAQAFEHLLKTLRFQ